MPRPRSTSAASHRPLKGASVPDVSELGAGKPEFQRGVSSHVGKWRADVSGPGRIADADGRAGEEVGPRHPQPILLQRRVGRRRTSPPYAARRRAFPQARSHVRGGIGTPMQSADRHRWHCGKPHPTAGRRAALPFNGAPMPNVPEHRQWRTRSRARNMGKVGRVGNNGRALRGHSPLACLQRRVRNPGLSVAPSLVWIRPTPVRRQLPIPWKGSSYAGLQPGR